MSKRWLGLGATLCAATLLALACSSSSTTTTSTTGTVTNLIGDSPFSDILSFRVLITQAGLPAGGTLVQQLLPANAAIRVNFAGLKDASTLLNFASVPEGTYNQAMITFSVPQLTVFDPTKNPPISVVPAILPPTLPTYDVVPSLLVTRGQIVALHIDFDLLHSFSFTTDASGQLVAIVNPKFRFTPVQTPDIVNGFGRIQPVGFIQKVDPTPTTTPSPFVGDFQLGTLSGTAPGMVVNFSSNSQTCAGSTTPCTQLCGPAGSGELCPAVALNQVITGGYVTVDGYVNSKGNVVADQLEIEDTENLDPTKLPNKTGFIGDVLTVNRGANSIVTDFTLFIREEEPDTGFTVALDSVAHVTLTPGTVYFDTSRVMHPGGLALSAGALAPGQQIAVHGHFIVPPTPPPPATRLYSAEVTADSIYVQLQSYQGNFLSLLQAGADDKSGVFLMAPGGQVFQGAPFYVVTDSTTKFLNVAGLNEMTSIPQLWVKGYLFYDQQGRNINLTSMGSGVVIPPGSLVLYASLVHQL